MFHKEVFDESNNGLEDGSSFHRSQWIKFWEAIPDQPNKFVKETLSTQSQQLQSKKFFSNSSLYQTVITSQQLT